MRKTSTLRLLLWFLIIFCVSACQAQDALYPLSTTKAGVGYGVYVNGGYAYITNNEGVLIFDVQDPKNPKEIGSVLTGYTKRVVTKDGLAYIACEHGLVIADIRDPAVPERVGAYDSQGIAQSVSVDGNYAYLAGAQGLEIVDVSNPDNPVQAARLEGEEAWGVAIYENYIYLAVPNTGLEVIDVRDPFSPQKIRTAPGTQAAWDVHIYQGTAYVGCHSNGVIIFNLSNKESPELIGRYLDDDGGEALGIWGDSQFLYVADNFGIEVLDVQDPTRPQQVAEYGNTNGAHDIYVDGNLIYVAEGRKGLMIFEFKGPQER